MGKQDTVHSPENRKSGGNIQLLHLTAVEWNIINACSFGSDKYIPGHIFPDGINGIGD